MSVEQLRVSPDDLRRFIEDAFVAEGYGHDEAVVAADVLVYADRLGLSSHGVRNLLPIYMKGLSDGSIQLNSRLSVVRDVGALIAFDGGASLGLLAAEQAMRSAMSRARTYGVSVATVRNSTHFGAAGYYAAMAAEEKLIGLSLTNLGRNPVAHAMGSVRPNVGTNPIGFAAPSGGRPDLVLDMSTTVCASGRIKLASARGENVPPGWLLDRHGSPVATPDGYATGDSFLPVLGGWREATGGHKGFGLNLLVETLAGVLSGASLPLDAGAEGGRGIGHFFLAINADWMNATTSFRERMDDLLGAYLECDVLDEFPAIAYPGAEKPGRHRNAAEEGVTVPPDTFAELATYANERSIDPLHEISTC